MSESKKTVKVRGLSPMQTYPASTISSKYGLAVDVVRRMKLGGEAELTPTVAMALKADSLVTIIKTKEKKHD